MAISNCLFLPNLEIRADFQFVVYLLILVLNHAMNQIQTRCKTLEEHQQN